MRPCSSEVKRPVGDVVKCISSKLFASRRRVSESPGRSFKGCAIKSVGCGSLGNSGIIGNCSEAVVNGPRVPRVVCNFKKALGCGG